MCVGEAARAEALACRAAHDAGFEWPPHRAASSKPPWELQPGSGRRGPADLWRRSTLRSRSSIAPRPAATWSRSRARTTSWPLQRPTWRRRSRMRIARRGCWRGGGARRSAELRRFDRRQGTVGFVPDRWRRPACRRGSVVVVGSQRSRRVASELLSALARSSRASTSSGRMRNARPTRTAGSVPWSTQLRIVCAVTWNRAATSGTVSSCRSGSVIRQTIIAPPDDATPRPIPKSGSHTAAPPRPPAHPGLLVLVAVSRCEAETRSRRLLSLRLSFASHSTTHRVLFC